MFERMATSPLKDLRGGARKGNWAEKELDKGQGGSGGGLKMATGVLHGRAIKAPWESTLP